MGADYTTMLAKLQMQQAMQQQNSPSLFGLQAAPDPNTTAALLKHLQDQQYVDEQGNQGGEYGFLANAGKKDFARAGQNLGNALGIGSPAPVDNSAVMAQRAALQQGKSDYQQAIAAPGADPMQAQIDALTKLAANGVPGADAALEKANDNAQKLAASRADIAAKASQSKNWDSEVQDRTLKQARETAQFIPRPDLSNSEYMAQQDPNTGKIEYSKRGDKMPPPPLTPAADSARDILAKKVANYDLQLSTAVGRGGGDMRQDLLTRAIAINPEFDEKNYKQSSDALKAFGPAGTLGQQTIKLQNAINHLGLLDQYGKALDSNDPQAVKAIENKLSQQFGGTAIAGYNAIAPIVASEVSSALVKGGGGVEERAEKARELGAQLTTGQRSAATQGMRNLLAAQYKNYEHNYKTTTRRSDFQDMFPVEGFGDTPAAPAATPATGGAWQDMGNGVKVRVKQ